MWTGNVVPSPLLIFKNSLRSLVILEYCLMYCPSKKANLHNIGHSACYSFCLLFLLLVAPSASCTFSLLFLMLIVPSDCCSFFSFLFLSLLFLQMLFLLLLFLLFVVPSGAIPFAVVPSAIVPYV